LSKSWGVDIGGTTTVVGLLEDSQFTTRAVLATNPNEPPQILLQRIMDIISADGSRPHSIGIGAAGFVDRCAGILRGSPNLPLINGFPLRDTLRRMAGCNVIMENDCNAFAIGALHSGEIPREGLHLFVTLGTGIGGTIVSDGNILFGEDEAGEFGHMTVKADGIECPCGNRGCWECYASARSLQRYFGSSTGNQNVEPKLLAELARKGDRNALAAFQQFGEWIGIGLSNLGWCFNPSSILLGGGLTGTFDLFSRTAETEYSARCFSPWRVRVLPLCSEAGAHGAAVAGAGAQG